MNRFDAPDSIFAPLVVALPPDVEYAGFANALFAARGCVPIAEVGYTVKKRGRLLKQQASFQRRLVSLTGDDAQPFSARIRMYDRPEDRSGPIGLGETLWEVGVTHLKDGLLTPAVPEHFDSAIMHTTILKHGPQGVAGAPQLALLRHLWAASVTAASPEAIVFGGQHHWDDAWWTESIESEGAQ